MLYSTCMDDAFVEHLLKDDTLLFLRYMSVSNKKRQSASNILPVLIEKRLIED